MKKIISFILIVILCLSFIACGKSAAVKNAEDAIATIGEVTINSGDAITHAEKLFSILTDAEKAKVDNRMTLVEARENFDKIRGEIAYKNAKEAYEKLKNVYALCVSGMDAIYSAWYYGIYEADADYWWSFDIDLALELSNCSFSDIETAREALGISEEVASSNWQYSVWVVQEAMDQKGVYNTISENMTEAEKVLQALTEEYGDYTYYPKLKDYYASIKSYVEFFNSPTGSFSQLSGTISNYENNIRTLESDVSFLFNK